MPFSTIGRNVIRVDAIDKVTGRAKYASDIALPSMLQGKILRSTHPHARILNVDTSRAERLLGVKGVLTSNDLPPARIGMFVFDQPICARDKVRYVGEPVAAIAACDSDTALEALELIRVEYEELTAVFDPVTAMSPEAPILHEDLAAYKAVIPLERRGNILSYSRLIRGDAKQAFERADIVFEAKYTTQAVDHGHIEPHEAIAETDNSGRVRVWTEAQGVFDIRSMLSSGLGLPMSKVRVIGTTVGGSFGGKMWLFTEPFCVALSQKTHRPVKIGMTREEEFLAGQHRHPAVIDLKAGATQDGRLVGLRLQIILDTGAYETWGAISYHHCTCFQGPYRVADVDVEGFVIYTNNTPHGAMRGPIGPQLLFAIESHMDALARELELDPLEFRQVNAVRDGDLSPISRSANGPRLHNTGFAETLQRVAIPWYRDTRAGQGFTGRGIACGQWAASPVAQEDPSSATIKVNEDGTVVVSSGASELGGGTHTIVAEIAAEELGVSLDAISVVAQDTDATPYESGVGGSRATYRVGNTVRMAAADARNQLVSLAAAKLEANLEDLQLGEGKVYVKGSPEKGLTLAGLATVAQASRKGPIIGSSANLRDSLLPDASLASFVVDSPCYSTHLAEVQVDTETGEVSVLGYLAAHDVGFAINPISVEGQIEGGVVMGIGYGLTEECISESGKPSNITLSDYKMPTAMDVPMIQSALIEHPSTFGPYGAKGVAEPPVIPVAAAIANAVHNAVGVRIRDLPLSPERLLKALKADLH